MAPISTSYSYISINSKTSSLNDKTFRLEKDDGSVLRYCNGSFTTQPNFFSQSQRMSLKEAKEFVCEYKKIYPRSKKLELAMEKTLKEFETGYPEIGAEYSHLSFEPSENIQVWFGQSKGEEKIIIKKLTINVPKELPTGEVNKDEIIIYRWIELKDPEKIKELKNKIKNYVVDMKPKLSKTNVLLANLLDKMYEQYIREYF